MTWQEAMDRFGSDKPDTRFGMELIDVTKVVEGCGFVVFTANGNKVEFDKKGNWEEVDCKHTSVPVAIIPAAIQKYVTTNYPDAKVLKIERDKKDYEVKLSNRTELKFDLKFNLIDIDN